MERELPQGRPTGVLLAVAEWRLRAPLRAQLVEDGYDVMALETWDEAELLLQTGAVRPRLIVLDVQEETNPEAGLRTFRRLARTAPVVVLTAPSVMPVEAVRALGFAHVLARPFRIRDIEAVIRTLLPVEG